MPYDAGAIESDREIMLMPIPETPVVPPVAADPEQAPAPETEPMPAPQPEPAVEQSETPVSKQASSTNDTASKKDAVASPTAEKEVDAPGSKVELKEPVTKEPKSSSDGLMPLPEEPQLPQQADPTSAPRTKRIEADAPSYIYDYGADNSQTIDFSGSDSSVELGNAQTTVLSDFDIRLDGVGLIE